MSRGSSGQVIVVGAGLAGLAAAHRLASLDFAVTVLEARARAGGKHARETLGGVAYEPWPAGLPRSAPGFAELAHELGLGAALAREPLSRVAILRDGALRSRPLAVRAALGGSPLAPFRLRRLALLATWLGGALDPDAPWRETRLDDRSAADFARVYLGRRALESLVAPLFAHAFGLAAEDASRQLFFALLDARGDVGLDALAGAGALAEALAARLGDLRAASRVERIDPASGSVRLADGGELRGDAVVLAVPAGEAARLLGALGPRESAAFAGLRAQPGLVLAALTPNGVELPERDVFVPAREGGELAGIARRGPGLLHLVARPDLARRHGRRPDAELAHLLLESAARAAPELGRGACETRLHRFPALPAFAVGHYRALAMLRAALEARPERRVFLAGDWCSAPHVEGELASGLCAANEVAARLGAPP